MSCWRTDRCRLDTASFGASDGQVTIRDVDPANPSFVNGLPASERTLEHGDRIRIGSSTFVLTFDHAATDRRPGRRGDHLDGAEPRSMIVMRREDVLIGGPSASDVPPERLERDLAGLMRVSAAISAVRGLAALERPLIELIADVVPADRGAVILCGDHAGKSRPRWDAIARPAARGPCT